jgi:uncharacterized protein YjeT (DUF2065 family)
MTPAAIGLIALGGFILLEGLIWAVIPSQMRGFIRQMLETTEDRALHHVGLVSVFLGMTLLVWGVKVAGG